MAEHLWKGHFLLTLGDLFPEKNNFVVHTKRKSKGREHLEAYRWISLQPFRRNWWYLQNCVSAIFMNDIVRRWPSVEKIYIIIIIRVQTQKKVSHTKWFVPSVNRMRMSVPSSLSSAENCRATCKAGIRTMIFTGKQLLYILYTHIYWEPTLEYTTLCRKHYR